MKEMPDTSPDPRNSPILNGHSQLGYFNGLSSFFVQCFSTIKGHGGKKNQGHGEKSAPKGI